jgi:hypothetical protein
VADEVPYWGPAQIKLYTTQGTWIDDACAIQYRARDEKSPKWGYFDQRYRTAAQGQSLIQGQLSIEFRYWGYLNAAIARAVRRHKEIELLTKKPFVGKVRSGEIPSHVLQYEPSVVLELLSEAAQSADKDMRDELFAKMQEHFWDTEDVEARRKAALAKLGTSDDSGVADLDEAEVAAAMVRPGQVPYGFDIMMIWGADHTTEVDPSLTAIIKDVNIIGESKAVEIGVPDGSRSIREVYTFFAKDIVSGLPQNAAPPNKKRAERFAR